MVLVTLDAMTERAPPVAPLFEREQFEKEVDCMVSEASVGSVIETADWVMER